MAEYSYSSQQSSSSSSQRTLAMVLALVSAVVLSPLYVRRKNDNWRYYDTKWSSGFVLPMVLVGLVIAIRTSSASSSSSMPAQRGSFLPGSDPSLVLRIGSSSWGLAGVLVMLMLVLSWQDSVQEFFWR
ncbi:hypothetical protein Tsubulata_028219 [Turnera subulata]|uniref:Uncharacterized protein n=1 Tax=Turnera subulata TaxID=218843 RepID=A0A9Q0FMV4_9ROSI|nr:hypothetical protein Tsubulata_028219 [Turnera subulata]